MASNKTEAGDASESDGIFPGFRPGRLQYGPARWLSIVGTVIAIFPAPAGLNGQLAFPVWAGAVVVGFLTIGTTRIWDATKREGGVARDRILALLVGHLGIPMTFLGIVASEHLGTGTRIAASGIGTTFVALGYVWNRRLLQARDALRTDERLRSLKHRAAYRVAQLTYGLIVLVILLTLVIEPTASVPIVPSLVSILLLGALSYAAFYGYYEVQY